MKWLTPLRPALSKRLRQQMQALAGRRWQREGWCAFAVDGSRVECPRTEANEHDLKCAGKKKTGPQLFLTTLLHMGTGLPWDFRIGPGTASERRHAEEMLADLPPRARSSNRYRQCGAPAVPQVHRLASPGDRAAEEVDRRWGQSIA